MTRPRNKVVSDELVGYVNTVVHRRDKTTTTTRKIYRKVLSVVPSCSFRRASKLMKSRGLMAKGLKRKTRPRWASCCGCVKANYDRKRRVLWIVETRLVKTELVSHECTSTQ